MGSGMAWDCSVGVLCCFGGKDHYTATGGLDPGLRGPGQPGHPLPLRRRHGVRRIRPRICPTGNFLSRTAPVRRQLQLPGQLRRQEQIRLRRPSHALHAARRRRWLPDRSPATGRSHDGLKTHPRSRREAVKLFHASASLQGDFPMFSVISRSAIRTVSMASLVALGCLCCGVEARATDKAPSAELKADTAAKPAKTASKKVSPQKKVLTAEQTALRDRTRETLAMLRQQPFSTNDNTPSDLIHLGWAFGCETEIHQGDASGSASTASPLCAGIFPATVSAC